MYILRCADDSLYTGIATDVKRRIQEHNEDNKRGARYTRGRRPVTLIYMEPCADRSTALQREARIKRMPRAAKMDLIASVW